MVALRKNKRLPLTTSDGTVYLDPADATMQDCYTSINYMVEFGIKKVDYLEAIWALAVSSTKTTTSHENMKATMEAIRRSVEGTKRSRL